MRTTLEFWSGNALLVLDPFDLRKLGLVDGSSCRVYAAAQSLEDLLALIAEYRARSVPPGPELAAHIRRRWISGPWPPVMDAAPREPGLWLDPGPVYGKEVTRVWP